MRWSSFVRGAWRQLPVETVIVAAAAVGAVGGERCEHEVWFPRLLLAAMIATPLAFAAHRLERFGRRVPVIAGSLAAAAALAGVTAGLDRPAGIEHATFYWPYLLSLVAAVLVPFIVPGPPFARFVRRFFEQTTTWGVLCGCAVIGVRVVALAIHELFDLEVDRLGVDASIVAAWAMVLIYLHRLRADDAAGGGRIPELWRRLATVIGAPFVTAMLAILVAYEVVARVRGELPRNMLSPLILAAGLVGSFTTLIISSVVDEPTGTGVLSPADPHRWARRASVRLTRAFPVVLLALLPMAWWALGIRIEEHGITPFRAVRGMGLCCLTGLSGLGAWRWLHRRAAPSWEVPAAVAGFALLAAFGPISAVQLSIRSQSARLAHLLAELEASRPAGSAPGPEAIELDGTRYDELHDAERTVVRLGGEPALRRALDGAAVACSWDRRNCPERLDVYRRRHQVAPEPVGENHVMTIAPRGRFAVPAGAQTGEIESFELHRPTDDGDVPPRSPEPAGARGEALRLTADRVLVHIDGTVVAQASLAALLAPGRLDANLPLIAVPAVRPDGTVAADLAIELLDVWVARDQPVQPRRLSGIVIWRR